MAENPIICLIEDDNDIRVLIERGLEKNDFTVISAADPVDGEALLRKQKPDLILLDVMMPRMNGYDFCAKLQNISEFAAIPVVFMTALGGGQDKAKAFAVGAADFVTKPVQLPLLLERLQFHLAAHARWATLAKTEDVPKWRSNSELSRFRAVLADKTGVPADSIKNLDLHGMYGAAAKYGLSREELAKMVAEHLKLGYLPRINPETIELGVLPGKFSATHKVVAMRLAEGDLAFVVADPFHEETLDMLRDRFKGPSGIRILVTEPGNIDGIFKRRQRDETSKLIKTGVDNLPVTEVGDHLLEMAVHERASDLHIEPKEGRAVIRCRIDGDMREIYSIKSETALQVVSRFKALADLDVAERRKPQDGVLSTNIDGRNFIVRLATTATPNGESLVMRLLEPWAKAKSLSELGMADQQVEDMKSFAQRNQGLVVVAGPTGSGKTTTIYSLLQHIDTGRRSLMSIEDPVEYRITSANQQEVDEKAGLTFEALLKSAVRQDPDILFLGEMRDQHSSKMAVDFSSTGHLTISTVHTANATTAIFRLERIGISRGAMADSILGVIAQKLVKRLCDHCKDVGPITAEERGWLEPFTKEIPETVAREAGCEKCRQTGFLGREGVYEIIKFYPEISEMIRKDEPISRIRDFCRKRGDYLISDHSVSKVRDQIFSPREVYENILLEEAEYRRNSTEIASIEMAQAKAAGAPPLVASTPAPEVAASEDEGMIGKARRSAHGGAGAGAAAGAGAEILVVEDDDETRTLIERVLRNRGYDVTQAADGVEALMAMATKRFDLILTDYEMPNLNGLKFMELKANKGIETPVVFLTGRLGAQDESEALNLGAADYIRKPVSKDVLLMRIQLVLSSRSA
jgi:type IV pilus assembly protein PilB